MGFDRRCSGICARRGEGLRSVAGTFHRADQPPRSAAYSLRDPDEGAAAPLTSPRGRGLRGARAAPRLEYSRRGARVAEVLEAGGSRSRRGWEPHACTPGRCGPRRSRGLSLRGRRRRVAAESRARLHDAQRGSFEQVGRRRTRRRMRVQLVGISGHARRRARGRGGVFTAPTTGSASWRARTLPPFRPGGSGRGDAGAGLGGLGRGVEILPQRATSTRAACTARGCGHVDLAAYAGSPEVRSTRRAVGGKFHCTQMVLPRA